MMPVTTPIRIIHADDHRIFRKGVRLAMERYPHIEMIGEAENGKDLLQQLEYRQPDMVLLNMRMPVMDGLQTLPLIRQRYPAIKVIILTMNTLPALMVRALELGASCYLLKSVDPEELYQAITTCMRQWVYFTPEMIEAVGERRDAAQKSGVASIG